MNLELREKLIWQEMYYGMIKCDDSNKQWLLCKLRYVSMTYKLFSWPNEACWKEHFLCQRRISCEKWTFYQEVIKVEINYEEKISLMSLIVIQVYMKLYVMQEWRVGIGNKFIGTKLEEGQLGCAEKPMLGWRNVL